MDRTCFILLLLIISACGQHRQAASLPGPEEGKHSVTELKYARNFSVKDFIDYQVVKVFNPWKGGSVLEKYLLFRDSSILNTMDITGYYLLKVPVRSLVPLSTSYYGFLDKLGELNSLAAVENKNYVYHPGILDKIQSGELPELGQSGNLSIERTISLQPGAIVMSGAEVLSVNIEKIRQSGIPVLQNMDWQEQHPLGRAEWVKFFGVLSGKAREADSIFKLTETAYHDLARLVSNVQGSAKKKVLLGYNYQGTWFMPGGRSYVTRFLNDAGAFYLYSSDTTTGSIPLSYELVFSEMADAPYWLHPGVCRNKKELLLLDPRYSKLRAFRENGVYNQTLRSNSSGGNDFWESGPASPQLILADLIAIFHPELLPGHSFYFYEQLK